MKPEDLKDIIRAVREEQEESNKTTPWMRLRSVLINWLMGALAATTAFVLVQWFKDSTEDADKAREFSKTTKTQVEAYVKASTKESESLKKKLAEFEQAFSVLEETLYSSTRENQSQIKSFGARVDVFSEIVSEMKAREIGLGVEAPISLDQINEAKQQVEQRQDAAVYRIQEGLRD